MEYLLVWNIKDYPECGGGIDYQLFDTEQLMTDKVNEQNERYKGDFQVILAIRILDRYEYEPTNIITAYKIKE